MLKNESKSLFFKFFVPVFLVLAVLLSYVASIVSVSEDISQSVFRLHILANSDSAQDQALKLKVRDSIIEASGSLFEDCTTLEETIEVCSNNLDVFKTAAEICLKENNSNQSVKLYIDEELFDTRTYGELTLPAGTYNALKIELGEGRGHNWWCVMFPALCLPGATQEADGYFSEEEKGFMTSGGKYEIKFKIVELYEKLKYKLEGV